MFGLPAWARCELGSSVDWFDLVVWQYMDGLGLVDGFRRERWTERVNRGCKTGKVKWELVGRSGVRVHEFCIQNSIIVFVRSESGSQTTRGLKHTLT